MKKDSKHTIETIKKMKKSANPWNKGKKGIMPEPWNKGKILVPLEIKKQHHKEADNRYKKSENYKIWRDEYRKRPDVLAKERAQTISYRSQSDNHGKRTEYLNRPEVRARNIILRRENRKRPGIKEREKEYENRPEVKEKRRQHQQEYYQRPEVKERGNKWRKEYRNNNPCIKLKNNISRAIHRSIKESKNGEHWEKLVGYTLQDVIVHIEKLFTEGMTWDKFLKGEIHLDHIIPISRFNFSSYNDIDFKRCWALSNLQPLWMYDNLSKGDKIKEPFQPCLALEIEAC